ncbi:MAG: hypothetical protein JKY48_13205 [Flavobacteriales bacterium]|nr:hypothetical protein [Flavobacteriales bacterium]
MKFLFNVLFYIFISLFSTTSLYSQNIDSLTELTNSNNLQIKNSGLIELAEYYIEKDSLKCLQYAEMIPSNILADVKYDSICIRKINLLTTFGQSEKSTTFALDRANFLALELDSSNSQLITWNSYISELYFNQYQYQKALPWVKKNIKAIEGNGVTDELGKLTYQAGVLNYALSNYLEALEYAFKATEIFQETKNDNQLAASYLQLGNLYYFLDSKIDAEEYYRLAKKHYISKNDSLGYANCVSNIGLIKIDQKDYQAGIDLERQALPIILKSKNEIATGNIYHYLSEAYLGLKMYDSSSVYVDKSILSNKKTFYYEGLCIDYLIKTKIALEKEDSNTANKFLKRAQEFDSLHPNLDSKKDILFLLSQLQGIEGNFKEGFKNFKRFYEIEDKLRKSDDKLKLLAFKQKSKLSQIQYELNKAKDLNKLETLKNKEQKQLIYIISGIAIVLIVMLIIAIILLRRNKTLAKSLGQGQQKIKDELAIKESLLNEIHHRVKNNLQVVSSMLSLQTQFIDNNSLQQVINDCRSRINSMSLIHESLYKKEDGLETPFNFYIEQLIPQLIDTYQVDESKVKLIMTLDNVFLSLDESLPCGLLINEIVSNSLKHAFPNGQAGQLKIDLFRKGKLIALTLSDNGIGFDPIQKANQNDTFGLLLIDTLVSQLEAEFSCSTKAGVHYEIKWTSNS